MEEKLVSEHKWGKGCYYREYLVRVADKPTEVIKYYRCVCRDEDGVKVTRKRNVTQKFLCVNGGRAGNYLTEEEGRKFGYVRYNCSDSQHCVKTPANVLIC